MKSAYTPHFKWLHMREEREKSPGLLIHRIALIRHAIRYFTIYTILNQPRIHISIPVDVVFVSNGKFRDVWKIYLN